MDLDIDKFIFEIECRPAIWNIKCEAYSDRVQRVREWEEVVNIFTNPGISIDEKRKQGQLLQKKWRNLRDAFVKERRQLDTVKSGSAVGRKQYKYYKQLLFLLPVISTNTTDHSLEDENNDSVGLLTEEHVEEQTPTESARKKKKSNPNEDIGNELINVLKSTLQRQTQEEDSDRQFLLSLVDDFKTVPMRLKPMLKMNILKCIMDAQDEMYDCHQIHHTVNHNEPCGGYITKPDTRSETEYPNVQPSSSNINQAPSPTTTSINTLHYVKIEDQAYLVSGDTQDSDKSVNDSFPPKI